MQPISRYLVTTADEKTWELNRPIIFLGEWCRIYDRRQIWSRLDAIVAKPYGLDNDQRINDYKLALNLRKKIFPTLCNLLNKTHQTNYDNKFWLSLLGHWYNNYINVLINRIKTIENCIRNNKISGTTVYDYDYCLLASKDTKSSIFLFNDDFWNNILTARILVLLDVVDFPIKFLSVDMPPPMQSKSQNISLKLKVKKFVLNNVRKLLRNFVRDNDTFILNSYLPHKKSIELELALGQCPQLWRTCDLELHQKPDQLLRQGLSKEISSDSEDRFKNIISLLLFETIPICFLEGFTELNTQVSKLKWPRSPEFIFTSNSFDTDEIFKLWTLKKIKSGARYYVGQHGNNYGTNLYSSPTVEELVSDKFLTWGWKNASEKYLPAFIFKNAGEIFLHNTQGSLLLVESAINYRISTWDDTYEYIKYFNQQINFVKKLELLPRQHLVIRLSHGSRNFNFCDISRWYAHDSSLEIDLGKKSIWDLIAKSRLVIYSYDSTGLLEILSQNIPTLAFWQNKLDHLNDDSRPYYQLLVDAKILHFSAESLANKVNQIWDNVDGWWQEYSVQEARMKFCSVYARRSEKPIEDLKKLFRVIEK